MKTINNFVWKTLTSFQAKLIYETDCIDLFILNEDGSETLIETKEHLFDAIEKGSTIALEVGYITNDNNNQFDVYESSAIDRMYMSDQWVQAQRDERG